MESHIPLTISSHSGDRFGEYFSAPGKHFEENAVSAAACPGLFGSGPDGGPPNARRAKCAPRKVVNNEKKRKVEQQRWYCIVWRMIHTRGTERKIRAITAAAIY